MQLLYSMTGASPETRLLLLAWVLGLGASVQSLTKDGLAETLNVPKRHLGDALDYLVLEGYLWRVKSRCKPSGQKRMRIRFNYGLTPEAWKMGFEWAAEKCIWRDEIDYVLGLPQSVKGLGAGKTVTITPQTRLVWIALLLEANLAGYVIGCDFGALSRMLGMSEEQFHRGARALSRKGFLSIAANHAARTHLFEPMPPVYKLQPQSRRWKVIKLGVSLGDSQLIPLRFLFKLGDFYRKAAKRSRSGRLPIQSSNLSDERYFELSKIFHNPKLCVLVQQVCLSTIFSLASSSIDSKPDVRQDEINQAKNSANEELRKQVRELLSTILPFSDLKSLPTVEKNQEPDKSSDAESVGLLGEFTLSELTSEVANLIEVIAKRLRTFTDCFGTDPRVLNHYPRMMMRTMLSRQDNPTDGSQLKGMTGQEPDYVVNCVLDFLVPNDKKFADCLILGDVLYTANSRVTHPNISQVEQLICFGGHTKS
ncbi:hypothetical protein [Shewanella algae]|uniref:hypothetical protein n=1 Tax=Shewanella algae TaxID=38313 RepID=UPI0031F5072D